MKDQILYEKKIKKNTDFNVWMAFPGSRSFALSALGYMFICKQIDTMENIQFEPIYLDTKKTEIMSKNVNLLGFSFSFDMDFISILTILEKHNFKLKSSQRDDEHALIFGGGPVLSSNPEPYFEIFDFIIIGDGEDILKNVIDLCRNNKDLPRIERLKLLSELEGVYVPSIGQNEVKKLTCKNLNVITTPLLSQDSFFPNTFIIEVERGCSNRCGFCIASYINLPIRFLDYDEIIKNIDFGLQYTNKIALLGAMIAKHPRFDDICNYIYEKVQNGQKIELSFSSLRADNITDTVVKTLVACGQKHSTIAIEAASERLRKIINKNLTENQIFNCVKICKDNGLKGLKIYAILGLPNETQEDVEEFIVLAKKLKSSFKGFNFSFAFSTFVPKPHTPFQWCKREDIKTLKEKQNYLKKEFHKLGIKVAFSSAKWDYYQSILSVGSRELSDAIFEIYKNGNSSSAFKKALSKFENQYLLDETLPWDFIKMCVPKEFLKSEYKKLLKL